MLKRSSSGFTLIELMITVALIAILMSLAVPSMRAYVRRAAVKTAAEAFQNGIRTAQAEALRRNTNVEIVLTDDTPGTAKLTSAVASTSGVNWMVRLADQSAYITGFNSSDGSPDVTVKGSLNTVRFGGFGRAIKTDGTTLTSPFWVLFSDTETGHKRCVYVTPGGAVRMCDPTLSSGAGAAACLPALTSTDCV